METTELELKLCEIRHDLFHNEAIPIDEANKIRLQINNAITIVKNLALSDVSKSFTAEEVVKELKQNETLDDAISFFTEMKELYMFA